MEFTGLSTGEASATTRTRGRRNEFGVALVEFALLFPMLAYLVFGTIDLGRAFQTWEQVKNAAREGAIYASTHPGQQTNTSTCADPNNILWHAHNEGRSPNTYTITIAPVATTSGGCDPGSTQANLAPKQSITVTASTPFSMITPFVRSFVGNPTVSASVRVRIAG